MLYHFEKGNTADEAFRNINELFGEETIGSTVKECSLKNWMMNKVYEDLDELVDDVKAWIASKNRDFFVCGIDMLPSKWETVIEVDGEYAPE
uniref:Mos1 transposase HTH domain-containing protein n=1 Tax=Acrobeloides nanus TaxID=290746 RepID=A0A914CVG9_9BILA